MGYDLHITRRDHWSDTSGPMISENEWRDLITADPELSQDTETRCSMSDGEYVFAAWNGRAGALGHYAGEITATNPDQPLSAKMFQIARKLGAKVQGDDGEIYGEDGTPSDPEAAVPTAASPASGGLLSRIGAWFRHRRNARASQEAAPAFRVGQRVKNPWGVRGVVVFVDRKANGGLGSVRVRTDAGHELDMAYVASGLEIIADPGNGG
jgi:hypothetical protein